MSRLALPTLAALALTGTAGGIYLGRAAVAEIDPMYFSQAETRFHADLVPHRLGQAAGYQAGDLSQANLDQALGRGCVNCLTYPEEVLVHRASAEKYLPAPADFDPKPIEVAPAEVSAPAEFAAVHPYMSYPVAAQTVPVEAPAEAQLADRAAVEDESLVVAAVEN